MCLTQTLPLLCQTVRYSSWSGVLDVYYKQSRKRLGETHVWKTQRDVVRSITYIYSSVQTYRTGTEAEFPWSRYRYFSYGASQFDSLLALVQK